jgi:hypothetical protein
MDFSSEVATVTKAKPGRTCAQQQKQSSSCGAWSVGWSGLESFDVGAAFIAVSPASLTADVEFCGEMDFTLNSSGQNTCGKAISAQVKSRKKTATARISRPCLFLIQFMLNPAFIGVNCKTGL